MWALLPGGDDDGRRLMTSVWAQPALQILLVLHTALFCKLLLQLVACVLLVCLRHLAAASEDLWSESINVLVGNAIGHIKDGVCK